MSFKIHQLRREEEQALSFFLCVSGICHAVKLRREAEQALCLSVSLSSAVALSLFFLCGGDLSRC